MITPNPIVTYWLSVAASAVFLNILWFVIRPWLFKGFKAYRDALEANNRFQASLWDSPTEQHYPPTKEKEMSEPLEVSLEYQLEVAREELEKMRAVKDGAYFERNQVVAFLANVFPSGRRKTAIEGWSEDWHGCVYIDLPTGQASWHYHDTHAHLFAHLPLYTKQWDGHTSDEKYARMAKLSVRPKQARKELPYRDPSKPAEEQGLFQKYTVFRNDGQSDRGHKHEGCDYFVIDVDHDPHAKAALQAYSNAVDDTHPNLSADMVRRYGLNFPPMKLQPQKVREHWQGPRAGDMDAGEPDHATPTHGAIRGGRDHDWVMALAAAARELGVDNIAIIPTKEACLQMLRAARHPSPPAPTKSAPSCL